jgi:probable phosphoglycerate mutase
VAKIILTRHGHVAGIQPERFRGRADLPLAARGIAQAEAVAARISSAWQPNAIYTSPMRRCVATGEMIARACGLTPEAIPALNDIDYGAWQGQTHEEIKESSPDLYAMWRTAPHLVRFPDGESLQDLALRTADALRMVLRCHPDGTVVFVGHESVNRVLLMQCLDQPLSFYWRISQAPCALNEIDLVDHDLRVVRMNETLHLD